MIPRNIPLEQQALKNKQENNRLQYCTSLILLCCSQQRNWLYLIIGLKVPQRMWSRFTTEQLHKPCNRRLFPLLLFLTEGNCSLLLCFKFEYSSSRKTKSKCIKEESNRSNGIDTAKDKQKRTLCSCGTTPQLGLLRS